MQVKLLRILQEKVFTPVGSNRDVSVDVRVIAASHKPFEEMIKDGSFREDLFYRLNVLPVYLPPLRERTSDIPHLIDYYVNYFNSLHNLEIKGVNEESLKLLTGYAWPGNIRELRNVIEHAFIIESSDYIQPGSLPDSVKRGAGKTTEDTSTSNDEETSRIDFKGIRESVLDKDVTDEDLSQYQFTFAQVTGENDIKMDFQVAKDLFEKEFIQQALRLNKGKINQTALKANIPKKTLLRKIEKYEINPKDYY